MLRELVPTLWPAKGRARQRIYVALGLLGAGKVLNVQVPVLFKTLVERLEANHHQVMDTQSVVESIDLMQMGGTVLAGYFAARLGSSIFNEFKNVLFSQVSLHTQKDLAIRTFSHLHTLPLSFYSSNHAGALSRIIERGMKGINFAFTATVFNVAPTIVEIGLVSGLLWYQFNWQYSAVALSTLASYAGYTFAVTSWRTRFRKSMNSAENDASRVAYDSLANHELVKQFTNENFELSRYKETLVNYESSALKGSNSLCLLNIGQNAIFSAALAAMMAMTVADIGRGRATIGDLVMVNGLIFQLSIPLNILGGVYRELKQSFVDMEALLALSKTGNPIKDPEGGKLLHVTKGEVYFDSVSFDYDAKRRIVNKLNLLLPAGKRVAIVGPSGSGKSTLARLLIRFVDPTEGTIFIDGQPINSVSLASLRRNIGICAQDAPVFNATIKHNIAYGRPDATDYEIAQAAEDAGLADFVESLPMKYETVVGERGIALSGGERQRIAIARLLLRDPRIVILDEPSSNLDTKTERRVIDNVKRLFADRTVIIIAHRLSTIADCDLIHVMGPGGQIAESGMHEELIRKGGLYAELWKAQELQFE